jgi:hypothetical protein
MIQINQESETLSVRVVRRIAAKHGLRISKAHGPLNIDNRGEYQLLDRNNIVIGGANYEMTMDEIFDYLTALRMAV